MKNEGEQKFYSRGSNIALTETLERERGFHVAPGLRGFFKPPRAGVILALPSAIPEQHPAALPSVHRNEIGIGRRQAAHSPA